jgi:ATP-dependent helicase HrpB
LSINQSTPLVPPTRGGYVEDPDTGLPAPLLVSEGKSFPVETVYLGPPGRNFGDLEAAAAAAVRRALGDSPGVGGGDVLCFLPGAAEIRRVVAALQQQNNAPG